MNTRNISGMLLNVLQEIRCEKLNYKHEHYIIIILVCGCVASSVILIFAVIGHSTINIPEIIILIINISSVHNLESLTVIYFKGLNSNSAKEKEKNSISHYYIKKIMDGVHC